MGMSLVAALAYPLNMAVLQGVQDYTWLGINQALGGPAKFLFTVLFVWAGFGVSGVMAGMVASGLLLWAMSYFPTDKHLIHAKGSYGAAKHISFTDAIPVFLAVFAFTLLTQADMVLVNRYFSAQETTGIYASAGVLGKTVMYIPGAIVLALFPMVSEQYALFLFHDSLRQIVFIMLTAGTLLLVTGITIQYVPVLQPNIKGRESSTPV